MPVPVPVAGGAVPPDGGVVSPVPPSGAAGGCSAGGMSCCSCGAGSSGWAGAVSPPPPSVSGACSSGCGAGRRAPVRPWRPGRRSRRGRRPRSRRSLGFGGGSILQHRLHEGLPDPRRERAAGHRLALELGLHRLELLRVADPDRDGVLGRPADEPGVAVVLGRAGLAGHRDVGDLRRACAVPFLTTPWRIVPTLLAMPSSSTRRVLTLFRAWSPFGSVDRFELAVVLALDRADADRAGHRLALAERARAERAVGQLALARERLVGVRHVERRDALLEAAERHRPVVRDRRADAHPARELGDPLGARLDARPRRTPSCRRSSVACASVTTPA